MAKIAKHILDRLKKQREKINARIQAQEARLKTSERKQETRRKILIGSYFLDKARKENTMDSLISLMNTYLTRSSDRALFDLEQIDSSLDKNESSKQEGKILETNENI